MNQEQPSTIYDFTSQEKIDWIVVNDGVMGGLSKGSITRNDEGNGVFSGYVTTENNGGFSSIRYEFNRKSVSSFQKIQIRLKGDSKKYQFRIKSNPSQRYSYIHPFKTSGSWETITLDLNNFVPKFRGSTLDKPNYPGETMSSVSILIGNGRKENFKLEIESIYLE